METYKDHITLTPDVNDERLQTLRRLFPDWFTQEGKLDINEVKKAQAHKIQAKQSVTSFAGLASRLPSAMPSRPRVPPCTMTQHAASMPTKRKTSSLRAKTSKCSRFSSRAIARR